jgi:alpha-N-arabinofuranosidase
MTRFILIVLMIISTILFAQNKNVEAVIDAGQTQSPISKYVYGQFIEHIANIINHNLWAEMLDDRKFYYPVLAEEPAVVQGRRAAGRRWIAIGNYDKISMDTQKKFSGEHSPRIMLNKNEKTGILQNGLALKKDKSYSGRIILAADNDLRVSVSLIWGESDKDRQTQRIDVTKGSFKTWDLNFTATKNTTTARFEISATGSGSLWIGAVSLMPADNMEGYRREVITLLKSLKSGVYRFPGGNFVSAHEWRDAIGDRDKRPPIMDPVWQALQPNDVGTDEFMVLCRLLEVEPYITVNAGFGDAWSAAQLVEYCNESTETAMGKLRADNGHPEPYNVKFWGVGNEAWGSWQMGTMPIHQFVVKHDQFAKAMLKVDPSIKLIGSGAMPDAMTCSGESVKRTGNIVTEYLSAADWSGGLIKNCLENLDMISEHFYTYANERFDITKGERVPLAADEPLVEWMRRPANHVKVKAESYQDYLELIPELQNKKIPIVLAEWAYSRLPANSYKVVPAYAWVFHEMFRHSHLYQMANFTFVTSLMSLTRTDAVLNPAGLMFKLYSTQYGHIPVLVTGNSPQTKSTHGPGGQDPEINAGSPTFPLDVAAALTEDLKTLAIAVINPTESTHTLDLNIKGVDLKGSGSLWRMAPDSLNAQIVVSEEPAVQVEKEEVTNIPDRPVFAPFSVSIYRFDIK